MVKALIIAGAAINLTDRKGIKPLDYIKDKVIQEEITKLSENRAQYLNITTKLLQLSLFSQQKALNSNENNFKKSADIF